MTNPPTQTRLSPIQIEEFHHELFVDTQVEHFESICGQFAKQSGGSIVDIGGGCGFFAAALEERLRLPTRVIDLDAASVDRCVEIGVEAHLGDALHPPLFGDEGVVCFNLILHHMVADTEAKTEQLQADVLSVWQDKPVYVFVNEYIYDSYGNDLSGKLIYAITSSPLLSKMGSLVAQLVPSLRANTFGVGVRFRAERSWVRVFEDNGWDVVNYKRGKEEVVPFSRRLLFIKSIRRDSFVLRALPRSPGNGGA